MSTTKFDMDELLNCMHCGFCLPACPTFRQTGLETYSPRGRISLMKGVAEDRLPVDEEFEKNMYACLGCRACETACPAGVKYGELIETAREVVEDTKKAQGKQPFARRLAFKHVFLNRKRVEGVGRLLWAMQASGLQKFARQTGLMKVLPREMAEMQSAVDTVASPRQRRKRQSVVPADPVAARRITDEVRDGLRHALRDGQLDAHRDEHREGQRHGLRVGLFTGCIMDVMFYETNEATAKVLSKAGCTVEYVANQECCGALHAHSGEKSDALALAKRNIEAFEKSGVDFVVNNAGGCGAALKEYHHWLKGDAEWADRARRFVEKVRDISELLMKLPPISIEKSLHARVTYQDSCHLAHGQGVRNQPRDLIRSIPGVEYVELPFADSCCGSAGIYNITNYDMSMKILDDKMKHVEKTKANIIVTANPGCLLQMKKGIIDAGLSDVVEAVHIVDLLNRVL